METTVTEAGRYERMLTLTLDEVELEPAKNAAARKLAKEIKIKGFRPGKAPRAVIERTVGADSLRAEAIDDALPGFVADAIQETELDPVTTPRIEAIRDGDDGGVEVDIRITLWPKLDRAPVFEGRKIEVEPPTVGDDEISEQIDRFRAQFAELEDVERPADDGDFVMINLSASRNGEAVEEASAEDLLYGIGSHAFLPGLDELLLGASPGDIREGTSTLPEGFGDVGGAEVDIKVLVKAVRGRKLPEVTDDWVADVSEFESVDELTEQLRTNMRIMKLSSATSAFQDGLLEALVDDADIELPEPLVEAEMEARVHNMAHALEEQGIDFANYLRITGQDQEAFTNEIRERATRNLKTQLILDAVIAELELAVDDDDIDSAVEELAASAEQEPAAIRSMLEASGQVASLTGDILRRKALDRLIEAAVAVDGEGNEVDLTPPVDEDVSDSDETGEDAAEVKEPDGAADNEEE